jgi:hypothetical protein
MKFITNKAITAKYKLSKFYIIGVIIFIVIFSGLTLLSVFLSFVKQ